MRITIGVPVHNCVGFTKITLLSLMETLDPKHFYDLIVVDNASTDNTKEVIDDFCIKFGYLDNVNIDYHKFDENHGCAKSFNYIYSKFDETNGDYCILINNDIVFTKNWLQNLLEFHESYPEAGMFSPTLIDNHVSPDTVAKWFGDPRNNVIKYPSEEWEEYALGVKKAEQHIVDEGIQGPLIVVTRECRDKVGNWDENFIKGCYDDCDMVLRTEQAGFKCFVTHNAVIFHFGGSTQWYVTTYGGGNWYQEANKQYFQQKWKVNLSGAICSRSMFWRHPAPGINERVLI